MMDVEEAAFKIAEANLPLLCLDTCSILDIVRDPRRREFSFDDAKGVIDFLARAESNPPQLCFAIGEQVSTELSEHLERVQDEGKRSLEKLDEELVGLGQRLAVFLDQSPVEFPNLASLEVHLRSRSIVDRILACGVSIQLSDEARNKALSRIADKTPPGRKGHEIKDCLVIETYIELAEKLRILDYGHPICFLSSNTSEYVDPASNQVYEVLAKQLDELKITYSSSYVALRYGALNL